MNDTSKILVAGLAGAAVGVVAGLMIAPGSGQETRKKVFNTVRDRREELISLLEKGLAALKTESTEGVEKAESKLKKIVEKAQAVLANGAG